MSKVQILAGVSSQAELVNWRESAEERLGTRRVIPEAGVPVRRR